jgi:hypothetical protein
VSRKVKNEVFLLHFEQRKCYCKWTSKLNICGNISLLSHKIKEDVWEEYYSYAMYMQSNKSDNLYPRIARVYDYCLKKISMTWWIDYVKLHLIFRSYMRMLSIPFILLCLKRTEMW